MQRHESALPGPARAIALCLLACATAAGCTNEGNPPPAGVLNFPTAALARTIDPLAGPRFLYVANTNFDLRYNAATLQSYDLEVANTALDALCSPVLPPTGCRGPIPAICDPAAPSQECLDSAPAHSGCALVPRGSSQATIPAGVLRVCEVGPGAGFEADPPLLVDEVRIGSFAAGMELSSDGTRLYLPIGKDADVTRVDLDELGQMDCGGGFGTTVECNDAFRRSDRSVAADRGFSLPSDPVAIAVGPLSDFPGHTAAEGDYIVMAHGGGEASYFIDPRTGPNVGLVDVLPGFPTQIPRLRREPGTGLIWGPSPVGGAIARIGVALDATFAPSEVLDSFLFNAGSVAVPNLAVGSGGDLRDVAFEGDRAYLLSGSPAALLIGRRTVNVDELLVPTFEFDDVVRVGAGPSRLELATLDTSTGPRLFAFVTCFTSRNLYVIDVDLGQVVAVSPEFSGPFEIEIDTVRKRLYVIDFRTSVIRIVDLGRMLECLDGTVPASMQECAPELLGLIGVPDAAEELE